MNLSNYHYYGELAIGASYTPPAKALATYHARAGQLEATKLNTEQWDGGAWICNQNAAKYDTSCSLNQDASQNLRVKNDANSARKLVLNGGYYP